jgi:hypothetical protein
MDGFVGRADGFDWFETELVSTHTNGSQGGTPLVDGSSTEADGFIHIDGVTSGNTWTKGTVFTVDGVYKVNPITKDVTPELQDFVVTADTTFTGGEADVPVSPALYAGSNGLQNIDALPADGASITLKTGSASTGYAQNLAYHKSAFRMVSVPLVMPVNAEFAAQETVDGITVAVIRDFDVKTRKMITRLDFLGALAAVRPEFADRVTA